MGITFSTDLAAPEGTTESPCLCAQMTAAFLSMMRGEDSDEIRAELAREARPDCPQCEGKGVEREPVRSPHRLDMNLHGFNVLRALGLAAEPYGQCTIAEARRALLRARNQDVRHLLSEDEVHYGAACEREDGAIELRPVRGHSKGLSRDDLARRVSAFEAFVRQAADAGAQVIHWF